MLLLRHVFDATVQMGLRSAVQFIGFFGAFAVSAFALSVLAFLAGGLFRQFAWPKLPLYLFGPIGTPVHELSHALCCLLFGHRIHKIKWFDAKGANGAMGSVAHAYDAKNVRHRIGLFFIGAAPAFFGPLAIAALFCWLAPAGNELKEGFRTAASPSQAASFAGHALFAQKNWSSPAFWLFIYLATAIASHVDLSKEDLKQVRSGAIFIATCILAFNGLLAIWAMAFGPSGVGASWAARASAWGSFLSSAWLPIAFFSVFVSAAGVALLWMTMSAIHVVSGRPALSLFRRG